MRRIKVCVCALSFMTIHDWAVMEGHSLTMWPLILVQDSGDAIQTLNSLLTTLGVVECRISKAIYVVPCLVGTGDAREC